MKLRKILREQENQADSIANTLLLFDKLAKNPTFMAALGEIKMPMDKYRAIMKFAGLLGIPETKFDSFMTNMKSIEPKEENPIDNEQ